MNLSNSELKPHTKKRYYYRHLGAFRQELRETLSREEIKALHQLSPGRHFALVARQLLLACLAVGLIVRFDSLFIWLPCSIVLGFIIFDFTVLLHEVVHNCVFQSSAARRRWNPVLGWLYAIPSGISKTQFTRWHLDHHAELGSWEDDPKRAHLTPKINARWYKFLYMTPALFPIYFRAAAKEAATYPLAVQHQVRKERQMTIAFHLGLMGILLYTCGGWLFFTVYAVPYFFVFPIAFTLNRMGQHYDINPDDVAQWSTLMKGHWFWDRVFLFSNYHLEHHYYPGVPCYNLPRLQTVLQPLYQKHGMTPKTYRDVLVGWFWDNQAPHTLWE
jgi:fatty acid desaturase